MSVPAEAAIASNPARAHLERSPEDRRVRTLDIAVVIVTYKSAQLAIECLKSLLAEHSPALHIRAIVVDNASADMPEIAQAVEHFGWSSWVTLITAPRNGGFSYGNNLGIERAYASGTPSYVYLLNPDAQVRPGAIGSLVRFLDVHPEVGIAGSSFENVDGTDWPIAFRFPNLLGEVNQGLEFGLVTWLLEPWTTVRYMKKSNEPVDWICGASMMIRSEVFAAIGGLDENFFLFFEETDFCRRAGLAGFSTWYVPESRVMHIGGHSTAKTDTNYSRLQPYWFESRRRYFAVTFGVGQALAIDVVAVLAHSLGLFKRAVLRRRHTSIPYFIRDLIRHSVLWKRNRNFPPVRHALASAQPSRPHFTNQHPTQGS